MMHFKTKQKIIVCCVFFGVSVFAYFFAENFQKNVRKQTLYFQEISLQKAKILNEACVNSAFSDYKKFNLRKNGEESFLISIQLDNFDKKINKFHFELDGKKQTLEFVSLDFQATQENLKLVGEILKNIKEKIEYKCG